MHSMDSFSNDELQYMCELLSCDPATSFSLADDSFTLSPFPPPHQTSLQSSPTLTSDLLFPSSPLLVAGFAKRDWLSSLSPSSTTPSTSAPAARLLSSLSSLANSYSLTASSRSLCARALSPTTDLQTCKTMPKLRHHDLLLNPGLSHSTNMQSKDASGKQCALQPEARGSILGANAYGVALRLSDVKAALQAMQSDSHLSNSANTPAICTLNSSTSANSGTLATSGMNQTNRPALTTTRNVKTAVEISTNVDEWLQRRCTDGPNGKLKRRELKNKKTRQAENVLGKVDEVIQETRKTHEFEEVARRREIHICTDRERRQGMKNLYGTLRSLLPDGKTKVGKCSVLTGTMEYIQCLLKQLDELGKEKLEVIMSMKENKKITNTKLGGETNTVEILHTLPNCKHGKIGTYSNNFVAICDNKEMNYAHAMVKVRNREGSKSHTKEKGSTKVDINKIGVELSINSENVGLQNPSNESHNVKDGAVGKKLYNPNINGCGGEKVDDDCIMMNEDKSAMESHGTSTEVGVRFFGEDAFINVRTSKKRGAWSSLLEFLQHLGIYILNLTLSTSPNSNHHRIHAKVSSCKLSSSDLQERLTTFFYYAHEARLKERRQH